MSCPFKAESAFLRECGLLEKLCLSILLYINLVESGIKGFISIWKKIWVKFSINFKNFIILCGWALLGTAPKALPAPTFRPVGPGEELGGRSGCRHGHQKRSNQKCSMESCLTQAQEHSARPWLPEIALPFSLVCCAFLAEAPFFPLALLSSVVPGDKWIFQFKASIFFKTK